MLASTGYTTFMKLLTLLAIFYFVFSSSSCRSCKDDEPAVKIVTDPIVIEGMDDDDFGNMPVRSPNVRRIDIKGGGGHVPTVKDETTELPAAEGEKRDAVREAGLPPETYEETDLTARLREKMLDAYGGKEEKIPDVKIYISDMKYDEFITYYQNLGYDVKTVAVPAKQVIEPVLEQRPELAGKIKLSDYEGVVIHQVMVNEAGISAADKYIDPDTFEVVEKTFVTKMNR